ncbi:hypothetical protein [uncultured Kriegella sp.]|uniref:hypothetical protein n=1 Tax=uncultured Kriegella sp. TaxID=1798910 RepID=UPI0030DD8C26|tara:strand:+ start:118634 stop:119335 length:702 start_codon:yes stop_codon:yes gene_type:complete
MKSIKYLLITGIFLVNCTSLFSHALFIQTNLGGKKGVAHEVSIFYSEPNENRELIADWWSDTSEFKLWLTLPDGTSSQLGVTKNKDHFNAVFTPLLNGVYKLSIHHNVAALYAQTQYQFNSSAVVTVGNVKKDEVTPNKTGLFMCKKGNGNVKKDSVVSISLTDGEQPLSGMHVTVFDPKGWSKTISTNAAGIATFTSLHSGIYQLEASQAEDVSGEKYNKRHRIITTIISVR